MNDVEGPTWETANGFTARVGPLWRRQVVGGVLLVPFVVVGLGRLEECVHNFTMGSREEALHALAISMGAWLVGAFVVRFRIALGWRIVDELDVDFKTRVLRLGQRRVRGRRIRTVEVHDLASVREVSYGSFRGEPLDWFEFKLKTGERIRFRCPAGLLATTRRALQRVGLLDAESWKGKAVQPAVAADERGAAGASRRR
jgi:hypothetical protein